MTRLQYAILVATMILSGFLGGAMSERLFSGGIAGAESRTNKASAEEFLLLDKNGTARAGLGLDANGEVGLVLTSKDGGRRLYLSPDDRVALKLLDRNGTVIWSAP
ncbi:MAG: hypothetical protein HY444_07020 [Nitrospirae bacterium]|nr:hypothetical protein [Nitrospirota bacterium]